VLEISAEKSSLCAITASRKTSCKFSQASRKPEKLWLGVLAAGLKLQWN